MASRNSPSKAVASARRSAGPDRVKVIVTVVVVLLVAGAVIGGILYSNAQKNKTEGQVIPAKSVSADYPVRRDGAVVVAGKDDAKTTVDIYVDMLCPFCRQFEETNAPALAANLAGGSLRVRYHLVTILNDRSDPPGYSLDAANAVLNAADAGKFPSYLNSLFAAQPEEGARGYSKDQLTRLGSDLGITDPNFGSGISTGRYNSQLQSANTEATTLPYLQRDLGGQKGFATPTIAVGQTLVDTTDPKWLDKLLAAT
jgi:protein-disulfide isomerase